jgi:hypothetical protein
MTTSSRTKGRMRHAQQYGGFDRFGHFIRPCISIEVGDGDGVSPVPTKASDALSLSSSIASLRTTSLALTWHLRLFRNQRTQTDNSEVFRQQSLDLIKAKVVRIELRLCVG